jgi:hypothetical protein
MRNYIAEKVYNTLQHFSFGGITVAIDDPLPENIDLRSVLKVVEKNIPKILYSDIEQIRVGEYDFFEERNINALYKDGILFISNDQSSFNDLLDDVIHEIAHHVEQKLPEAIYGDQLIKREFIKKRKELEFELRSEGYWTQEYDFENLKFDREFDIFLYKRLGKKMLKMMTSGMFIRPYASISLREYFATGFEAYYLSTEKKDALFQVSPELFKKIDDIDKELKSY